MNIKQIIRKGNSQMYIVIFKPNWLEKLFGIKEEQKEYISTGATYTYTGGNVYICNNGTKLRSDDEIGEAIDRWRRSW